MSALVIEVAPAAEPIELADMKNYLKVPAGVTGDDTLISGLIQAAREQAEGFTGRSLVNKGYRQSLDSFPYFTDSVMSQMAYPPAYYSLPRYSTTLWNYSQMVKLFRGPLQSITKISFTDSVDGEIHNIYPALFSWVALTEYTISEQIEDPSGNLQVVSDIDPESENEDGTCSSGPTQPGWSGTLGQTTEDGALTWTCMGPVPDSGDFIYDADSTPPRLFPLAGQFWPSVLYVPNAVQIHFIAGYGNDGSAVPAGIKTAMMQLVADWYFNRESMAPGTVSKLPRHVEALLWMHRIVDLAPTRG